MMKKKGENKKNEKNEHINTANAIDPDKGMFSIPEINREEVIKEASVGTKIKIIKRRIRR
jgi:hypothetical protein